MFWGFLVRFLGFCWLCYVAFVSCALDLSSTFERVKQRPVERGGGIMGLNF